MKMVQRIDPVHPEVVLLGRAAKILSAGRLVSYPTETFYGLAADPRNPEAVERVFVDKGRPERMALPIIAPDQASVMICVREFSECGPTTARLVTRIRCGACN